MAQQFDLKVPKRYCLENLSVGELLLGTDIIIFLILVIFSCCTEHNTLCILYFLAIIFSPDFICNIF